MKEAGTRANKWELLRTILHFRKLATDLSAAVEAYRENESVTNYVAMTEAHDKLKEAM